MKLDDIKQALLYLTAQSIVKITLSNSDSLCEFRRIVIKKSSDGYLIEKFTEKQAFHEKIDDNSLTDYLCNQLSDNFRQLNASCVGCDIEIKISKKGKVLTNRKNNSLSKNISVAEHNRKKNYIINEHEFVPALYELGVITKEGKVVASKYDKFKQINRFVECIDDVLKNEDKDTFNIIDFGCGKSYLTFVIYHYITAVKKKKANIVGLDLKKDVIQKCNETAVKYGYNGMTFICGDIKDYNPSVAPDIVVTLHACDTATDYALYNAVLWNSKYIFSVPCCQHELNSKMTSEVLSVIESHGLIKERFCALATDAVRAKVLEASGYKTDILEFVDMDNSPKNILIRASKKKSVNEYKKKALIKEINEFSKLVGHKLTIIDLFSECNII